MLLSYAKKIKFSLNSDLCKEDYLTIPQEDYNHFHGKIGLMNFTYLSYYQLAD